MNLTAKHLLVVLAIAGTRACGRSAPAAAASDIPGNFVPVHAEPKFVGISYGALRPDVIMVVRSSTSDLLEMLEKRYPQLNSEKTYVSLSEEELVLSGRSYYRRITMVNTDLETGGIHGHCSQWIRIWFSPNGDLVGVYPEAQGCPI